MKKYFSKSKEEIMEEFSVTEKGTAVSFVEGHDYKLLGKIKRYTQELLKAKIK